MTSAEWARQTPVTDLHRVSRAVVEQLSRAQGGAKSSAGRMQWAGALGRSGQHTLGGEWRGVRPSPKSWAATVSPATMAKMPYAL